MLSLQHIDLCVEGSIAFAYLQRPHTANALNEELWYELEELANWAQRTSSIRVVVLSAHGQHFCSGIDFTLLQSISSSFSKLPPGAKQEWLFEKIQRLQKAITAFEDCSKPVIAAIDGACIGGGIDLICACDLRYATKSAQFCVKEIDLAIVADIGTIQRLPRIVGEGVARELAYTARTVGAQEAHSIRLLNNVFEDRHTLLEEVRKIANTIASKSPLTVRNTKKSFLYSRDHTVGEGLEHVARMNSAILFSDDAQEAILAMMQKRSPHYQD